MIGLFSKVIGGALGVSGIIYGGYVLITRETIREKLIKDQYEVLNTENKTELDNSKWHEIVKKWSEMEGFVNNTDEKVNTNDLKIEKIKEKCKSILDTRMNEKDYESAKKYCSIKK